MSSRAARPGRARPTLPPVSEVLVGPGGGSVERILVQRHLDRPAREMLRVRQGSYPSRTAPPSPRWRIRLDRRTPKSQFAVPFRVGGSTLCGQRQP
jgi:hypothetical protein